MGWFGLMEEWRDSQREMQIEREREMEREICKEREREMERERCKETERGGEREKGRGRNAICAEASRANMAGSESPEDLESMWFAY